MSDAAAYPAPSSERIHDVLSLADGGRSSVIVDVVRRRPVCCSKSRTGGFKAASLIIGMEVCERLTYYAIQSNLLHYLQQVMRESSSAALRTVTNWTGVTLVLPLVGGFVADAYLGRYRAIVILALLYLTGLTLLTLSVSVSPLKPGSCGIAAPRCSPPTASQAGFFYLALYMVSVGTGGVKPCLEAFGADQFEEEQEKRRRGGFFSWWYFSLCFGGLLAVTVLVYVQNNWSWALGLGVIPTAVMSAGVAAFLAGTPCYRRLPPGGSPLTLIARVVLAALLATRSERSNTLSFLDKAATPPSSADGDGNPYSRRTGKWFALECTTEQVEDVKQAAAVARIWLATIMYGVVYAQGSTVFVAQVATMKTKVGGFTVPPASLQAVTAMTVMAAAAAYELAGALRAPLRRMGAGMGCGVAAMAAAALVDGRRLRESQPISALWTLPQFMLLGVADFLTLVAQQEFFYDQVPYNMRSLGMAMYLSGNGLGYFVSSLIQAVVNRASTQHGGQPWIQPHNVISSHYDYFFWLIACLCSLNFPIFISFASAYHYKNVKSPFGGLTQCVHPSP